MRLIRRVDRRVWEVIGPVGVIGAAASLILFCTSQPPIFSSAALAIVGAVGAVGLRRFGHRLLASFAALCTFMTSGHPVWSLFDDVTNPHVTQSGETFHIYDPAQVPTLAVLSAALVVFALIMCAAYFWQPQRPSSEPLPGWPQPPAASLPQGAALDRPAFKTDRQAGAGAPDLPVSSSGDIEPTVAQAEPSR